MKLKKLNTKGVAHQLALIIVVVAVATGGAAYLVATHAQTPATLDQTFTINPGTWQWLSHASITTDPAHSSVGNVVKLPGATNNGIFSFADTSTSSGQNLAALKSFINQYPAGKSLQLCVNARSYGGSDLLVVTAGFLKGTNGVSWFRNVPLTTSYQTFCYSGTTALGTTEPAGSAGAGGAYKPFANVANDQYTDNGVYVNYVKLSF